MNEWINQSRFFYLRLFCLMHFLFIKMYLLLNIFFFLLQRAAIFYFFLWWEKSKIFKFFSFQIKNYLLPKAEKVILVSWTTLYSQTSLAILVILLIFCFGLSNVLDSCYQIKSGHIRSNFFAKSFVILICHWRNLMNQLRSLLCYRLLSGTDDINSSSFRTCKLTTRILLVDYFHW